MRRFHYLMMAAAQTVVRLKCQNCFGGVFETHPVVFNNSALVTNSVLRRSITVQFDMITVNDLHMMPDIRLKCIKLNSPLTSPKPLKWAKTCRIIIGNAKKSQIFRKIFLEWTQKVHLQVLYYS